MRGKQGGVKGDQRFPSKEKHLHLDDRKVRYLENLNIFSEQCGSEVKFSQAQRTTSGRI